MEALPRTSAGPIARFGDVAIAVGDPAGLPPDKRRKGLHLVFAIQGNRGDAVILTIPGTAPAGTEPVIRCSSSGVANILLTCIRSALLVADDLTPQARIELGRSLDDLARLALRERLAPAQRLSRRSVMRERVKSFVRNHLHDTNLTIDDIATTFNCTKRYLHKVFSEDQRSLNQYIWDLRLERCSQDLANAELNRRSITEIAFIWGFRSSPHFSRAFRQRYGASPSVYRRGRHPDRQPLKATGRMQDLPAI
ncbi:MAG: helix-turn-helix domain-containing protein [Steroidobacteraceae bacterium]